MNKERRRSFRILALKLEELREYLEALKDEEQDYYDNMPESLQCSEMGERAEEAVSNLEDAYDSIDSAIDSIHEALD